MLHILRKNSIATARPRPGRPRREDSSSTERDQHIQAAFMMIVEGKSPSVVSRELGKSRRTILYWAKAALRYEGALPDFLRAREKIRRRSRKGRAAS